MNIWAKIKVAKLRERNDLYRIEWNNFLFDKTFSEEAFRQNIDATLSVRIMINQAFKIAVSNGFHLKLLNFHGCLLIPEEMVHILTLGSFFSLTCSTL